MEAEELLRRSVDSLSITSGQSSFTGNPPSFTRGGNGGDPKIVEDDPELAYLNSATLTRRQEYIDKEEEVGVSRSSLLSSQRAHAGDTAPSSCPSIRVLRIIHGESLPSAVCPSICPPQARRHSKRALYYRRNADYDTLITACSAKLSQNPRNMRALLIRASSYMKKKMFMQALQDYTAVLQLEPTHVDALFHRSAGRRDVDPRQQYQSVPTLALLPSPCPAAGATSSRILPGRS